MTFTKIPDSLTSKQARGHVGTFEYDAGDHIDLSGVFREGYTYRIYFDLKGAISTIPCIYGSSDGGVTFDTVWNSRVQWGNNGTNVERSATRSSLYLIGGSLISGSDYGGHITLIDPASTGTTRLDHLSSSVSTRSDGSDNYSGIGSGRAEAGVINLLRFGFSNSTTSKYTGGGVVRVYEEKA